MKDINIRISSRRVRIEAWSLAVCFLIAVGLNIYAIIDYEGEWTETLTSLPYVVSFAIAIYMAWTMLRLVVKAVAYPFRKK